MGREHRRGSVVFDVLNVACLYGFLHDIVNMAQRGHFWVKGIWKERVWKRAWALDDYYWRLQVMFHRSLETISKVCNGPKYMIWWQISDTNRDLLKQCEIMMKLISHSSLLRTDDVRLKGLPMAARFCDQCDLAAIDDVRHLVLQWPSLQEERIALFRAVSSIQDGCGRVLLESACDVLLVLLGRPVVGFTEVQMVGIWSISARHIAPMYRKKVNNRVGIG